MRLLDWLVLTGFLVLIVAYGVWKGRRSKDLSGYLLANRSMRWYTVALSIIATQASAITFLSTPGQAYTDGMRFLQFYFGLPLAMVVISATAVPIYHRLKVYTAYEYLESRFDLKTRTVTSLLFLIQRGLAAGLTIYAPSVIFSVILGWDIKFVVLAIGGLVTIYTARGGTRAVELTHTYQIFISMGGMFAAFLTVIYLLPPDVSFMEAAYVAGKMGKLNAIDFSFDLNNRYNFWSGLIGGFFVALSYFGTDQSQVQRYLTGRSITESRLGLLFNGLFKVPMQFFILFLGAMVFVFYQFSAPPIFFNPVETARIGSSQYAEAFQSLEARHSEAAAAKEIEIRSLLRAIRDGDEGRVMSAERSLVEAEAQVSTIRREAVQLLKANDAKANTNDTNYIFLSFVIHHLPAGLIGLVIAAVFAASMSSTASELNALASTSVIDIYRRLYKRDASDKHLVRVSRFATLFWGFFAIMFAEYASNLGSLVEAVNILGSLFYGTILGVFLLAFYFKRVTGFAAFTAAIVGEMGVLYCFFFTKISFLWYNVVGCLLVIAVALVISDAQTQRRGDAAREAS